MNDIDGDDDEGVQTHCRWAIVGDCDLTLSRYASSNGDEGSPFDIGRGRLGDLPQRREDDVGFGSLQWCGMV